MGRAWAIEPPFVLDEVFVNSNRDTPEIIHTSIPTITVCQFTAFRLREVA